MGQADFESMLWKVSTGLVVVVGLAVLLRYRNRSRRATTLGIVAVCGYGVLRVLDYYGCERRLAEWLGGPEGYTDLLSGTLAVVLAVQESLYAACLLLLVAAVVTDRKPPAA